MTACGWASSEWRRPTSSAAPTSAECVCTRGGRSAGAVGNHVDAADAVGRRDLWAEWAGPKDRGPYQGTIQRYNAEEECWISESVSESTEEDASWCVENRAKWSASPLKLQARPGAPFASDDYLKYDLDGQIRIAVPSTWKTGDQKSLAVEWAPVGAKKCLVARVEILMGAEPKMTSFLVEDLDEVLELSD